jgi:hypothetical protein
MAEVDEYRLLSRAGRIGTSGHVLDVECDFRDPGAVIEDTAIADHDKPGFLPDFIEREKSLAVSCGLMLAGSPIASAMTGRPALLPLADEITLGLLP